MKTNPLKDGTLTKNSAGIGTVTQAMLRKRAIELAVQNGRTALGVLESDWEQARQELLGTSDAIKQEILESASESKRWDPLPGSPGHKVSAAPSEDDEGRSDNQRLVEEGMADVEDDHERQANRRAS